MIEDTYAFFQRPDVVAEYASFSFLLPPEEEIFARYRSWIEGGRVLDVGVGAGRTTTRLASLASRYVGTDVSAAMIETCRGRFPNNDAVTFEVFDARDMRSLESDYFDFVLFSFNGLDLVGEHEDRLSALAEMRRVCRKGGIVCFSSENLHFAEQRMSLGNALRRSLSATRGQPLRRRVRQVRNALENARMWRRLNPEPEALARMEHALIVEERPRHELSPEFFAAPQERIRARRYFIRPSAQQRQLAQAGFVDIQIFDQDGHEVTGRADTGLDHAWWLYYVARKAERDHGEPPARETPEQERDRAYRSSP